MLTKLVFDTMRGDAGDSAVLGIARIRHSFTVEFIYIGGATIVRPAYGCHGIGIERDHGTLRVH